jgi:hypothetical protein
MQRQRRRLWQCFQMLRRQLLRQEALAAAVWLEQSQRLSREKDSKVVDWYK